MARRASSMGSRMSDSAKKAGSRLLADWAALTWRADSKKIGPLSISAINWIVFIALLAGLYFLPVQRLKLAVILGLWLLFTVGRAAAVMPSRRKSLELLYDQIRKSAGLPTNKANGGLSRIQVRRWGAKNRPVDVTVAVGEVPAASSVYARRPLENALQAALGEPPAGQAWLFTWPAIATVRVHLAPSDSETVGQQNYAAKVRTVTADVLRIKTQNIEEYHFDCSEWTGEETRSGAVVQVPQQISLALGSFNASNVALRSQAENELDKRLKAPGEWLYEWDEDNASLELTRVSAKSNEALRKRAIKKLNSDVIGLMRGGRVSEDAPVSTVLTWMPEKHLRKLLGSEETPPDFPAIIEVDFGNRNLSDRRIRDRFESDFDTSMYATYPAVTWLYDWRPAGSKTILKATAVAPRSNRAARKHAERRLRNVVESKFGSARNFVDCDVVEWQTKPLPNGEALPQVATVHFGDYDVTSPDKQEGFEAHWDSLTNLCDWHYSWSPAEGKVTMTAVPPLPMSVPFPEPESEDFARLNSAARQGKFILGPVKGGGDLVWDLSKVPHALLGGATGAGKSVTMTIPLVMGLINPDRIELFVCDPKRTDFTWTTEFPNVTRFAATVTEIVAAVQTAKDEMDRRQNLLARVGVRNIGELRKVFDKDPELARAHGPAPRRLILFFDELAEFLAKSANKDEEELKDEARSNLEAIARLGRAMEVNILAAAQKPSADVMSTQLRDQLGFRACIGPVNIHTSQQILNSDHGTRFPRENNPKGRAWAWDSAGGFRMFQTMYLPDNTDEIPLEGQGMVRITGAKERVRDNLERLGYMQTQITNSAGGLEPRWVKVEGCTPGTDFPDSFDDASAISEEAANDSIEDSFEEASPTEVSDRPTEEPQVPEQPEEPTPPVEPEKPSRREGHDGRPRLVSDEDDGPEPF